MKSRFIDKLLAILGCILVPVLAISLSALIPCLIRGFYTPWIYILDIPGYSGFSEEQIFTAYNGIMDFIWCGAPFETGLKVSEQAIDHFRDCIPLFWAQLWMALGSLVYLIGYFALIKTKIIRRVDLAKIPLVAYGGAIGILLLLIIGVWAAIDFDGLFVVFHMIAFPGKSNWVFDWKEDQVIWILPESYFAVCAVFIIALAILIMVGFILYGFVSRNKNSTIMMKKLSRA